MRKETNHITELLKNYLQNNLSEEESKEFQSWIEEDDRHRELLEKFKQEGHYLQDFLFLKNIDLEKSWDRFNSQESARLKARASNNIRVLKIAVCILIPLITVFLSLYFHSFQNRKDEASLYTAAQNNAILKSSNSDKVLQLTTEDLKIGSKEFMDLSSQVINVDDLTNLTSSEGEAPTILTIEVPKASYFVLTLSDSTKVKLNSNTIIEFPERFTSNNRRVKLKGEAYFEVKHNMGLPFIVEVEDTEIEVLGTKFNVNSYQNQVVTTLSEGEVKVQVVGGDGVKLRPGEQAISSAKMIDKQTVDLDYYLGWINGEFIFKYDNIEDILSEISRWYGIDIVYQGDKILPTTTISGSIDRNASLSEVIEMLEFVSDIKLKVKKGKLYCINIKN